MKLIKTCSGNSYHTQQIAVACSNNDEPTRGLAREADLSFMG